MSNLRRIDNIDLCYRNTCVKVRGRNAKIITNVLSFALVVVSIASLIKASNN